MSSSSQHWQRHLGAYNAYEVGEALRTFRPADLADPVTARRWVEFGKHFSQMAVTAADVEQMGFEQFYALKQIMAHTLTGLSDDTLRQDERIKELEQKERTLKREHENLRRIEEENGKKEARLEAQIAELKQRNDLSFAESSIDPSEPGY